MSPPKTTQTQARKRRRGVSITFLLHNYTPYIAIIKVHHHLDMLSETQTSNYTSLSSTDYWETATWPNQQQPDWSQKTCAKCVWEAGKATDNCIYHTDLLDSEYIHLSSQLPPFLHLLVRTVILHVTQSNRIFVTGIVKIGKSWNFADYCRSFEDDTCCQRTRWVNTKTKQRFDLWWQPVKNMLW